MRRLRPQFVVRILFYTLLLGALCGLLYFVGIRITIAPSLAGGWARVSACADWVTAIASILAIVVAAKIPKEIAKQQNKIALFEKRNNIYSKMTDMFYERPLMRTAFVNEHDRRTTGKIQTFKNYDSYGKRKMDEAILNEASFLFSPLVAKKISSLIKLRRDFYHTEHIIEEGLAYFSPEDFDFCFGQYADMVVFEEVAKATEFKRVLEKNLFVRHSEGFGPDGEPVIYNIYELEQTQDKIERDIRLLEEDIIAGVIAEMRIQ